MQPQVDLQDVAVPEINCAESDIDSKELLSLLDAELKSSGSSQAESSSTQVSVYCHSGSTASIEVSQNGKKKFTSLDYSGLPRESRARATSLAVAELLLLPEDGEELPLDGPDTKAESEVVLLDEEPLISGKALSGTAPGASVDIASDSESSSQKPVPVLPHAFLQAGPVLRTYLGGGQLAGAAIDLTWIGISVGAEVLAGGNGYGGNANSFNAYLGYDLLFDSRNSFRGVLGARACGGVTTSSNEGSGYLGATAFGGADLHLGRVWRTRLVAEVGHAGWSNNSALSHLQGFFVGASLLLGANPEG